MGWLGFIVSVIRWLFGHNSDKELGRKEVENAELKQSVEDFKREQAIKDRPITDFDDTISRL